MKILIQMIITQFVLIYSVSAQLWTPDLGTRNFKNPIIFADYSDPDVIWVGEDFYMVSSIFNCMSGILVFNIISIKKGLGLLVRYMLPAPACGLKQKLDCFA